MTETEEKHRLGDTEYTCQFKGNTLVDISPREERPGYYPMSVDHKQNEIPAMRAFFTFPPTRSTDGHGGSTITLEVRAISARSNDEFPPKQERRITTFNQSYHLQIAVSTPYS